VYLRELKERRLSRLVLFASLAAMACTQTDLNTPCVLVRGGPDGGAPIALLKSDDIIKNSANKDFISFGSTECEDQVCVRDSAYVDSMPMKPEAYGYCSTYCAEGSTNTCTSQDGNLDRVPTTKLSCRALLLDSATLTALKMTNPDYYAMVFGMTTSPFFCARSAVLGDAGM
jgi:hypothetical protein